MAMKRLFVVKDSRGYPVRDENGEVVYFHTKPAAKLFRNQEVGRTVGYGPDHKKMKTIEATQRGGNH